MIRHPALGLPPRSLVAGFPEAAERLRSNRARIGTRALQIALELDPTLRERYDEIGLRRLLRDTEVFLDRIALCVAGDDPHWAREFADWVVPIYRRRRVPMDDLVTLHEAFRRAVAAYLEPDELAAAGRAIDEAIRVFRWNRRIAGDARKRNKLLEFIYKGA
ncbi:MAG TPA: hypothetical protein VNJ28_02555 [Candidatus Limnocylindrales bacterium]|nr:hypothetical protein [Candidatus Limnocylindrales bacterium]